MGANQSILRSCKRMPEGPEIKHAADRLSNALVSKRLVNVYFFSERLKKYESVLEGAKVNSIKTRGKALLTYLDSGHTIYSHNQLYGRWYFSKAGSLPKTQRSLRMALDTSTERALLYSASDIDVLQATEVDNHPFLAKIGPDVLDKELKWNAISTRLLDEKFTKRQLASLFLDQRFLAGIGNYLRSEILFDAQVNPLKKPTELDRKILNNIARSSLKISHRAYTQKGVTNSESLVRRLRKKGLSRARYRHAVFGRDGLKCYVCETVIKKISVGNRRLYLCPLCQSEN